MLLLDISCTLVFELIEEDSGDTSSDKGIDIFTFLIDCRSQLNLLDETAEFGKGFHHDRLDQDATLVEDVGFKVVRDENVELLQMKPLLP